MHASAGSTGERKATTLGRIVGPTVAGISELLVFHPVDTVAKRLMSNTGQIRGNLNQIIFKKHADASAFVKWQSLFPGLGFGAAYKITQRVYKFGGQPFVVDLLKKSSSDKFDTFGSYSNVILKATAGSMIGVGEVALLPLDVLKIKAQTNPESLKGRGLISILREEKLSTLYRGAGWTAARNAPGSFSLFGGAALAKKGMGLKEGQKATFVQDLIASISGSVASITVAAPMDVVKTRIQNRDFGDPRSGVKVITDLIATEGPSAFFKGLTPKVIVVGPKLIFSFTIAQQLIQALGG
jgi:hypothetical protein|uniref:Mitochondrial carrier protein n=1 Tax=Eutreptiella gymnastica TaxID=73025 RepID=A0A7S4LCS1_9EUGL|eukprot:CAMPEP_0174288752 /NCGR_PEP_ID=MMETSP0809-20121228/22097_1 /TAXON_ID=73025 ORGANISM="Eutreptiella gymnastica-like, Strain CCMP1594" /NCGR_SAMPLE_ID=MMETSP0809 /ASSEMBLY_ACC=CAM_ASM_000658 /LENGTH=296 /DNA_ID=CAMNT_0015386199 /DNA_START=50 /DNA_END=940 /DNA_ORIENTATION=+